MSELTGGDLRRRNDMRVETQVEVNKGELPMNIADIAYLAIPP